jgi:hypothetical protein
MDKEVLIMICNMGVGALFGFIMFWVYRADRKQSEDCLREDRLRSERVTKDMLGEYICILKANQSITEKATIAMDKHAVALTSLANLIEVIFQTMRAESKK